MERIIEQKTSEAIKKLEKQFKSTFSAYTSTNDKSRKHQAQKKLEGNDDCTLQHLEPHCRPQQTFCHELVADFSDLCFVDHLTKKNLRL